MGLVKKKPVRKASRKSRVARVSRQENKFKALREGLPTAPAERLKAVDALMLNPRTHISKEEAIRLLSSGDTCYCSHSYTTQHGPNGCYEGCSILICVPDKVQRLYEET